MSNSTLLSLPFLSAGQAQKHVTHNDALSLLDGLVQLSVISRDAEAPPGSPVDGDRYLLGSTPTGDWSGKGGTVAIRIAGQWRFAIPREGWLCWVTDEHLLLVFDGSVWDAPPSPTPTELQNLTLLGVEATADSTNRLSVSSPAALFNHAGNGVQVKLNKNAASDTASFLYQTDWSGRAELGTAGDDNFHFKVSADGSSWTDALVIDRSSGLATVHADPTASLGIATKYYVDDAAGANAPGGTTGQIQFNDGSGFEGFTVSGDATLDTSTGALAIAAHVVSNTKLASMAAYTFKANATSSASTPQDLTANQALVALNVHGLIAARSLIMI
jgi:hypothetical protein